MRVGIIFPYTGLGSVPCLVAAIDALRAAECRVDVFCAGEADAAGIHASAVHVPKRGSAAFTEDPIEKPGWARPIPYPLFEASAGPAVRARRRRASLSRLSRLHRESPFSWFIGVDPEGLVEAEAWGRHVGVPYAYWSLEILAAGEIVSPHLRRLKHREIRANRGAEFTIVQDAARGALLRAENEIVAERLVHVPNAASGQARRAKRYCAHELLGIPKDRLVVLCAGTIARWCMTEEIVRAAGAWPGDAVLVVHSRHSADRDPYARRVVEAADPARVRFSGRPLSAVDYRALVDSADVGLALYRPLENERYVQSNLVTMGLSSGKVSAYLQAGLPLVVNRIEGPAGLVDEYACGEVVNAPEEIGAALERIAADYDRCSRGALRCFAEELDFERHFAAVLALLSHPESTSAQADR